MSNTLHDPLLNIYAHNTNLATNISARQYFGRNYQELATTLVRKSVNTKVTVDLQKYGRTLH
jgi:hypothetical protein